MKPGLREDFMKLTRRDLGKLALAAIPAAKLLAKPNSYWAGVQVGMNVPYSYGNNNMSSDETIAKTVELGVSAVECRTQPIEECMGSPAVASSLASWQYFNEAGSVSPGRARNSSV